MYSTEDYVHEATVVECTRIFSSAKFLISDSRNRMNNHINIIKMCTLLRYWLKEKSILSETFKSLRKDVTIRSGYVQNLSMSSVNITFSIIRANSAKDRYHKMKLVPIAV